MSKQKLGVAIFAGLLIVTGIASSGRFFDANALLDRFVKEPLAENQQAALPQGIEETSEEGEQAAVVAETEAPSQVEEQSAETQIETPTQDDTTVEQASNQPAETNAQTQVEAAETEDEKPEETVVNAEESSPASNTEETAETAANETESNTATEEAVAEQAEAATDNQATEQAEVAPSDDQASSGAEVATTNTPTPEPPVFDLLRVEPNGDMVVAGVTTPGAEMELVAGAKTLTKTTANANGEFVAILDEALEPGDYEIVLRSTGTDGVVMTSAETAIVSIPEVGSDEVIALVEAPGAPSRLITVPEVETAAATAAEENAQTAANDATSNEEATEENQEGSEGEAVETANVDPEPELAEDTSEPTSSEPRKIRIEAVEIDGPTVFVAGAAEPGTNLRIYANETLLGDTQATAQGRFLVEVNRDLPVGDYIIRADALSPNGAEVVMRAAVPFTRSAGEKLAAVAVPAGPRLPSEAPAIEQDTSAQAETGQSVSSASAENVETAQAPAAEEETGTQQATVAETAGTSTAGAETGTSGEAEQTVANNASSETANDTSGAAGSTNGQSTTQVASTELEQPLTPVENSVVIRRGDTLWHISKRVYGRGIKYTTIYKANDDQIRDPDLIWPGQIFSLPEDSETTNN